MKLIPALAAMALGGIISMFLFALLLLMIIVGLCYFIYQAYFEATIVEPITKRILSHIFHLIYRLLVPYAPR